MKRIHIATLTALLLAVPAFAADPATMEKIVVEERAVVELKDGGRITLDKAGHTYHVDAAGRRVRMKDGVVMEGKDGTNYLHKNDAIWKQITEKGTLSPNR